MMVLRSNKNVTRFVDAWQKQLEQNDVQHWDQEEFNKLLRLNMFKNHFTWWDHTDTWDRYLCRPFKTEAQHDCPMLYLFA